jgi:hypothetical protein
VFFTELAECGSVADIDDAERRVVTEAQGDLPISAP